MRRLSLFTLVLLASVAATAQNPVRAPLSTSVLEGEINSQGSADPIRLDLEAGELVELDLQYPGDVVSFRIVDLDGMIRKGSAPRASAVRESFVAPHDGVFAVLATAAEPGGAFSGTLASYGPGEILEIRGSLCAGAACSTLHNVGYSTGEWAGTEWMTLHVEVDADSPVDLVVVRVEGDTLRTVGLGDELGPFFFSDEIELKDGPLQISVRRTHETVGVVDYVLKVRRWSYDLEDETMPPPPSPPPAGRNDGGSSPLPKVP
ncbi:hypothetical protein [Rubrivirga sp.]|uniref:hypothetical protein n=1 Tax=Rubrivirga sp. TaxID=1885344 RepID=UPI003C730E86